MQRNKIDVKGLRKRSEAIEEELKMTETSKNRGSENNDTMA